MSIRLFLAELAKKRIIVSLTGSDLSVKGNTASLSTEDKHSIRAHKDEIVSYLKNKQLTSKLVPLEDTSKGFPFSLSQKGLWIASQSSESSTLYNMPSGFKFVGDVDVSALKQSYHTVCSRHILLHSLVEESEGTQKWVPQRRAPEVQDLTKSVNPNCFLAQEMDKPFDLYKDFPIRSYWLELSNEKYFFVTTHHLALDMLSVDIILNEMRAVYESIINKKEASWVSPALNYADYATWVSSSEYQNSLKEKVAKYAEWVAEYPSEHNLLLSDSRTATESTKGSHFKHKLDRKAIRRLKEACTRNSATLFMGWHALASKALSSLSNQEKIVLGVPISNRPDERLSGSVGFYINTLAVPHHSHIGFDETLDQAVIASKKSLSKAYSFQDVPFSMLVEKVSPNRSTSASPITQIVLGLEEDSKSEFIDFGLSSAIPLENDIDNARFDITLTAIVKGDDIEVNWEYKSSIFDVERIKIFAKHLNDVLCVMTGTGKISNPAIQDNTHATESMQNHSVVSRFLGIAKSYAEKTAVTGNTGEATYEELNIASGKVSRYLHDNGVTQGARVAIILPRGLSWIEATLGALKSGASYVPISVESSEEHLKAVIESSKVSFVITNIDSYQSFDCLMDIPFLLMDEEIKEDMLDGCEEYINSDIEGSKEAYLMFTSGTTGKPKGIAVSHKNIVRLAANKQELEINSETRMLHSSNVTFDATTFEVWSPLLNGGQVVVSKESAVNVDSVKELIDKFKPNVTFFTSKVFDLWADTLKEDSPLRNIVAGGEVVSNNSVKKLYEKSSDYTVYNGYGPTENTTFTTFYTFPKEDDIRRKNPPVGFSLSGSGVVILNKNGEPAPIGGRGEIVAFGEGVGIGYVGVGPEVSAKFNEIEVDGKSIFAYFTGDLGYIDERGLLNLTGRSDNEIKLRGFRIDLLQVRAALESLPEIDIACVIFKPEMMALAAYITSKQKVNEKDIKSKLRLYLPDYMIPQFLVVVDEMPTTSVGKINEKELLRYDENLIKSKKSKAPETLTEKAVFNIWSKILGHQNFGIEDNFFDVGGNSIYATQLLLDVKAETRKSITLKDIFSCQTINEMSVLLDNTLEESSEGSPISAVKQGLKYPCSNAQQRLWLSEKSTADKGQFSIAVALKLPEGIDLLALKMAIKDLVEKYSILRTRYAESRSGTLLQEIMSSADFNVTEINVTGDQHVNSILDEENKRCFDLSNDFSVVAQIGISSVDSCVYLFLTFHHIAFDGWSLSIFSDALKEAYEMRVSNEKDTVIMPNLQYVDYAAWEQSADGQKKYDEGLHYWKKKMDGAPKKTTFPQLIKKTNSEENGSVLTKRLPKLSLTPNRWCEGKSASLYSCLYASLVATIYRYTHEADLVIGSGQANRTLAGTEDMVGFFVNSIPLRTRLEKGTTFTQLLDLCENTLFDAAQYQSTPMDILTRELGRVSDGLFQVMLTLQNNKEASFVLDGKKTEIIERDKVVSENDLTLIAYESDDGVTLKWIYDATKYDKDYINAISQTFEVMFNKVTSRDSGGIGAIDLSDKIIGCHKDIGIDRIERKIHRQALSTPDKVAVSGTRDLSYFQLDRESSRLANYLMSVEHVRKDDAVGIVMSRDVDVLVAILAIAKCGASYVPIDPSAPEDRMATILSSAGVKKVLTNINDMAVKGVINIADESLDLAEYSDKVPTTEHYSVDSAFYIIHTSGSTGKPKGVVNTHRNLCVYLEHAVSELYGRDREIGVVSTSLSFDATITTLLAPLIIGGCVKMIPDGGEIEYLSRSCDTTNNAVFKITPAHIRAIQNGGIDKGSLKEHCFVVGGEALKPELVELLLKLYPHSAIINEYGPTEATVGCVSSKLTAKSHRFLTCPIGSPHANTSLEIIFPEGGRQPLYAQGELILFGDNIAKGYLVNETLQDSLFKQGYKTGDVVFNTEKDGIIYDSRNDDQIKVRGYRVSLGEVENVVAMESNIKDSVAVLTGHGDAASISVFCQIEAMDDGLNSPHSDDDVTLVVESDITKEIRKNVKDLCIRNLPVYMRPVTVMFVRYWPLTSNGKVDTKRLSLMVSLDASNLSGTYPDSEISVSLSKMWNEVFSNDKKFFMEDDFFEHGGHSLLIMKLISLMREKWKIELSLKDVYENRTLQSLASYVESKVLLKSMTQDAQDVVEDGTEVEF